MLHFRRLLTTTQRNREVAHRDLRTAIYARNQPQHTVSTHRPASGGLVQHNGERWQWKPGAQARDGAGQFCSEGLLGQLRFLHGPCRVGLDLLRVRDEGSVCGGIRYPRCDCSWRIHVRYYPLHAEWTKLPITAVATMWGCTRCDSKEDPQQFVASCGGLCMHM
jgi:hypothetical protein